MDGDGRGERAWTDSDSVLDLDVGHRVSFKGVGREERQRRGV
jgi:hypothetical protein